MRNTEARITLGVIAAREGDLDRALATGRQALAADRVSLPSLLMVSAELGTLIAARYPGDHDADGYLDQLRQLRRRPEGT
jgi:hypothetical protein